MFDSLFEGIYKAISARAGYAWYLHISKRFAHQFDTTKVQQTLQYGSCTSLGSVYRKHLCLFTGY